MPLRVSCTLQGLLNFDAIQFKDPGFYSVPIIYLRILDSELESAVIYSVSVWSRYRECNNSIELKGRLPSFPFVPLPSTSHGLCGVDPAQPHLSQPPFYLWFEEIIKWLVFSQVATRNFDGSTSCAATHTPHPFHPPLMSEHRNTRRAESLLSCY